MTGSFAIAESITYPSGYNCMAKESIYIIQKVLEDVMNELWKSRTPKEKIDKKRIRECLKSCGYRKYYENTSLITSLVTGIKPVQLTSQEVDKT